MLQGSLSTEFELPCMFWYQISELTGQFVRLSECWKVSLISDSPLFLRQHHVFVCKVISSPTKLLRYQEDSLQEHTRQGTGFKASLLYQSYSVDMA